MSRLRVPVCTPMVVLSGKEWYKWKLNENKMYASASSLGHYPNWLLSDVMSWKPLLSPAQGIMEIYKVLQSEKQSSKPYCARVHVTKYKSTL